MVTYAEDNPFPSVLMVEQDQDTIDETLPAAGQQRLVVGLDHLLYLVDDTGTATLVGAATGLTDPMTTRGDIIVRNASNATARLARGSAGTYLGSDGTDVAYSAVTDAQLSTSDITTNDASTSKHGFLKKLDNTATHYMDGTGAWTTPAGAASGLTLLEQHTASASATLDFTTAITSTYDRYLVTLQSLVNATNTQNLWLRFSTNGGSSYDTTAIYNYSHHAWSGSTAAVASGATQAQILLNYSANAVSNSTAAYSYNGHFWLADPLSTTFYKQAMHGWGSYLSGSTRMTNQYNAQYDSTTAVNAFRIMFASGNITSGIVRVYGVAK